MITVKTKVQTEPNTNIFIGLIEVTRTNPLNAEEYLKSSVNVLSAKRQDLLELVFILDTLVELANKNIKEGDWNESTS